MTSRIENIRAIGFDWDGTLVDSMQVKAQAFAESVIHFSPVLASRRAEAEQFFMATRGNPRFDQLKWLQAKFKIRGPGEEQLDEWSELFTSLYIDKPLPLFKGVLEMLHELKKRGYKLFLNSSVPHEDLVKTLTHYPELEGMFEVVLGTRERGKFRKGLPHLTEVGRQLGFERTQLAFMGDAADDVRAAQEAGSLAVRFAEPQLNKEDEQAENPDLVITSHEQLLEYFL